MDSINIQARHVYLNLYWAVIYIHFRAILNYFKALKIFICKKYGKKVLLKSEKKINSFKNIFIENLE